jgi:hypothetical protein
VSDVWCFFPLFAGVTCLLTRRPINLPPAAAPSPAPAAPPAPATTAVLHPSVILSRAEYFEKLFSVLSLPSLPALSGRSAKPSASSSMDVTADSKATKAPDAASEPMEAQRLAEKCWNLLLTLPTSSTVMEAIRTLSVPASTASASPSASSSRLTSTSPGFWQRLFPADNLHRLHYTMISLFNTLNHPSAPVLGSALMALIKEQFKTSSLDAASSSSSSSSSSAAARPVTSPTAAHAPFDVSHWRRTFLAHGGLRHLLSLLSNRSVFGFHGTHSSSAATSRSADAAAAAHSYHEIECMSLVVRVVLRFVELSDERSKVKVVPSAAPSAPASAEAATAPAPHTGKRKREEETAPNAPASDLSPLPPASDAKASSLASIKEDEDAEVWSMHRYFDFEQLRRLFELLEALRLIPFGTLTLPFDRC